MIYDKPVWQIFHDMVRDLGLTPGQTFTRQQALDWFARRHPHVKPGTVRCHLTRLSTNAPSRVHYHGKPGQDDLLFQVDKTHFRLYDPRTDPPPIRRDREGPGPVPPTPPPPRAPTLADEVADPAFKERLARLESAPLDTVVREAGVVLEDRLRSVGGVPGAIYGVELLDAVLGPQSGTLVFSADSREQEGVRQLFRGAMAFVRNPPMHRLKEYRRQTARSFVRLVDALLLLLAEGERRRKG